MAIVLSLEQSLMMISLTAVKQLESNISKFNVLHFSNRKVLVSCSDPEKCNSFSLGRSSYHALP